MYGYEALSAKLEGRPHQTKMLVGYNYTNISAAKCAETMYAL